MVVPLGPGKFYGRSLPRSRFHKPDSERVDPPAPVLAPLLSWASEAHWSMGGLSFVRHRLQGRIEGNIERLRAEREKIARKSAKSSEKLATLNAPMANKKRSYTASLEESEDEGEAIVKRGLARKLVDDFERVAKESVEAKNGRVTRSKGSVGKKVVGDVNREESRGEKLKKKKGREKVQAAANLTRSSPRLAKKDQSE